MFTFPVKVIPKLEKRGGGGDISRNRRSKERERPEAKKQIYKIT